MPTFHYQNTKDSRMRSKNMDPTLPRNFYVRYLFKEPAIDEKLQKCRPGNLQSLVIENKHQSFKTAVSFLSTMRSAYDLFYDCIGLMILTQLETCEEIRKGHFTFENFTCIEAVKNAVTNYGTKYHFLGRAVVQCWVTFQSLAGINARQNKLKKLATELLPDDILVLWLLSPSIMRVNITGYHLHEYK